MKSRNKLLITIVISTLVLTHVLWDYFNGGVPIHNVLANENLPGISNWWGILLIPSLSWILLTLIFKSEPGTSMDKSKVILGFSASLLFGIILSLLWELNLEFILQYLILTPVVLSLMMKVHKPECLLGFVLGMVYTFGGVLPIGMGLILLALSYVTYFVFNQGIRHLFWKLNK